MNIMGFVLYAINTPHFETELEIIQNHLDEGDQVAVLGCNADLLACDVNSHHSLGTCLRCIARRRKGLSLLSTNLAARSLLRLSGTDRQELRELAKLAPTIEELRTFRIDNFDIGYGVLSSLVSQLRDPSPDVEVRSKLVSNYLLSALAVYRSVQHHLDEGGFDRVYVYNGRYAPLRAVLRACQSRGVDCFAHERGHNLDHYALYENALPHDLTYIEKRIREAWAQAAGNPDRERIASQFFVDRAAGFSGSWYSFIKNQEQGSLPEDWDAKKHNVVVFNSSEDEFVAIGDLWRNPLYGSQAEALEQIVYSLSDLRRGTQVYLRMHPNLAGIRNEQVDRLLGLRADFLTVLPPEDKVSTYALLKEADKVLTFGSTVGIEAVYWGIPSILAGICFYRNLGGTYNPTSHEELITLLQTDLAAKDREPALIYGYYMATFGVPFKHFQAEGIFEGVFNGQRVGVDGWGGHVVRLLHVHPLVRRLGSWALRAKSRGRLSGPVWARGHE